MAVSDRHSDCGNPDRYGNPACETYPWFDLDWVVDYPDAPSVLTITGPSPTAWLSADIRAAIPIEECR
ncbi:hypothetical protein [Haloarcula onubensis]|uniref:Uncharacterized protein n=1 Tax=Haloarcula onubensis TaxID=2950539 RepID=A0ABU2FNK0_9EURY|nr:hypothetical protein [Halomicroarcula sp. S3CR25-11]MDS0282340.1 hypothetical protein [Halomicroarcula sp. S3CR25-11]